MLDPGYGATLDAVSRIERFANDEYHDRQYFPESFSTDIADNIATIDDDTLIKLMYRLRGKQRRKWKFCKKKLYKEFYGRSGQINPWPDFEYWWQQQLDRYNI